MDTQRTEILNQLSSRGWRVTSINDSQLEWWADEMWLLESLWSPVGCHAYVTFLVDPQSPHSQTRKKGEAVWAVMASLMKPANWQSSGENFTLTLGQAWQNRLPDFFEHLDGLRNYTDGVHAK